MAQALGLARRGYGLTSPNPMVGAILVKAGKIIGRGWHHRAGQPHAEIEALRDAQTRGANPRGAKLYVTLEPCVMCAGALHWVQLQKLVYGADDLQRGFSLVKTPLLHPKTEIVKGIKKDPSKELIDSFFRRIRE